MIRFPAKGSRCWVCVAAMGLTVSVAPARATEIKLWPFLHFQREAPLGTTHLRLLGPLVDYHRSAHTWQLGVRPFFFLRSQPDRHRREMYLLYPLASHVATDRSRSLHILGLFSDTDISTAEGRERAVTLFPLVFYRANPAGRQLSVLPFYARLSHFLGYEEVSALAFPLYFRLQDSMVEKKWFLYPFFSKVGGKMAKGYRLWPLYGWEERGQEYRSRYVLWPFYIRTEFHPLSPQWQTHLILYPWHARLMSNDLQSTSYGSLLFLPGYVHTRNRKEATETWGLLWPFWVYQKDTRQDRVTVLRFFPWYQWRTGDGMSSHFYFWPLYRHRQQQETGYRYFRTDSLFVLLRHEAETRDERGENGRLTLVPLMRWEWDGERQEGQSLALWEGIVSGHDALHSLYAPLWDLYSWGENERGRYWSLWWGAVERAGSRYTFPWHIDLQP